ncbi:SCO family protein [Niveibacterium umoris]|uniref:Cytochrome C oxidase subunit I n=1 Tax=Niveibacterium umoris TaxID=1193620 RepID=A0A840BRK4_9RHOO|nr:hypothetical protein [Niveibacterium umoris]MBB4013027.1 hypothetical protein [Niveibacterium umoris]
MKPDARRTLLLIAAVCLAPVIAGYALFWFWKPAGGANYGELLQPAVWQPGVLRDAGGASVDPSGLRGRWVMVLAAPSRCDEACRQTLWVMRQVRTAQGKDMDRIERVWLLTDTGVPDAALLSEHPGLRVLNVAAASAPQGRIELVDPLGNRMLRYPAQPEPKRIIKDLQRLMKYSRIG